jgi:hypothetical protein
MTVGEWQAREITNVSKMYAHGIDTTPEDKLEWCPKVQENSCNRTVLDQAQECVGINRRFTAVLSGQPAPAVGDQPPLETKTAAAQIRESATELAKVVATMDDEAFTRTYTTGMGEMPAATLVEISKMNMMYHFGQLSYIQMLFGDEEFRFPPDFFG